MKYNFRERVSEWVMSFGILAWGILILGSSPEIFQREYYVLLHAIMDGYKWGVLAILVGVTRLIFLSINGAWRPSAHIRAIGAIFGSTVWGSLLIPAIHLNMFNPIVAIYLTLLIMDLFVIAHAASDAKLADLIAKDRLKSLWE